MAQAEFSNGAIDPGTALARADHRLATAGSVLAGQVALGPTCLLDDQTVTRVRAMAGDLAAQLVGDARALAEPVRDMLVANRAILLHLHALAIETQLVAALAARRSIDPVLPPLVRRRIDAGAVGGDVAAVTTALLAVQTRLGEALRRMRLPLSELPGDLQHLALTIAAAARADYGFSDRPQHPAPHDDRNGRLALLRRVLDSLGDDVHRALRIDDAGVPLFLSALALASGYPREAVALATAEDHAIRLAVLLRAAGLNRNEAALQLLAIRPEADPVLADLAETPQRAELLLAGVAG